MKEISTLISIEAETMNAKADCNDGCYEMSPKADTIERLRHLARVAFSDTTLPGMPLIILN